MFTGLVGETGRFVALKSLPNGEFDLSVAAPRTSSETEIGASVAANGCCLTVTAIDGETLHFSLLAETLRLTNLQHLRSGKIVNLEQALAANGRFGGHLVQGHIDCAAPISAFEKMGADRRVEIALPHEFARYVVRKGSIAVDGISLTVGEVSEKSFAVWIIPHTFAETNLREARNGDLVNLEFDLLAKYVERLTTLQNKQ